MLKGTVAVWLAVMIGIAVLYLSIFPTFTQDANDMRQIIAQVPSEARSALSIDADTMLSFLGYYAFTFTVVSLVAGFLGMSVGLTLFTREELSKTTEFLLTKPVSRSRLFVEKFLAGLVVIIAAVAIYSVAAYSCARLFGAEEYNVVRFWQLNVLLALIPLWFYGFGVTLTQLVRVRSVIGTTLGVVFGFFVVGLVGAIVGETKFRYISPLKAIDFFEVARGSSVDLSYLWLLGAVMIGGFIFAMYRYVTRDVRSVT